MSSLGRKIARKKERESRKAEKKLTKVLNKFDKIPNNCLVCEKEFDRGSKQHAMEWSVVVKTDVVRLYCPECWSFAINTINKVKEESREK